MTFDFSQIDEVRLARGNHSTPEAGLCFMEMVAWFEGEKHSDKPECACPVLGAYGIRLNDSMPDDMRDRLLKPLVPLMAGTRDKASEQKRAEFLAMWAVNRILPVALRTRGLEDHALHCEKAATLVDATTAANVAAYATTATYAADAAVAAAKAATYAANARAADAAYAAAKAATYAANARAADAAVAASIWTIAAEGLRQAILIGRHDGFNAAETVLAERRAKLREMVG